MTGRSALTREDVYRVRYHSAELGWTAARIWRELVPHVGLETVRRVIRGESHRGVGHGRTELAQHSNRLTGENRATGDTLVSGAYEAWAAHERERDAEQLAGELAEIPMTPEEEAEMAESLARLQAMIDTRE